MFAIFANSARMSCEDIFRFLNKILPDDDSTPRCILKFLDSSGTSVKNEVSAQSDFPGAI